MQIARELGETVGVASACAALNLPRSSYYRKSASGSPAKPAQRSTPQRALTAQERADVVAELNSERFMDQPPRQVFATLLDEGTYLCSVRTMYRLLAASGQVRERRDQLCHPTYRRPELVATAPNQVWSWDITKLLGPAKWTYFHLYVLLDIFSRYVVAWLLADRESNELAKQLIEGACESQGIQPGQLTLHADNGSPMTAKSVALLLADLGVTKSHSRPHVSNDNPYSEAQFKTLKYRPGFPERFGSIEHGRSVCRELFRWYNHCHYHTGLGLLTPAAVHSGQAVVILERRNAALTEAYAAHPERFVRRPPRAGQVPAAAWINPPRPIEVGHQGVPGRSEPRSSILDDPGASMVRQLSSNSPLEPDLLELAAQ
jgi:transposase InsO family protein